MLRLFFFLLPLLPLISSAQKNISLSLSGTVTDAATGKPLASVNIQISDTKQGATTNEKGLYRIASISPGQHLLEISHVGYNTIALTIDISESAIKDFRLSEEVVENNAVIVTGTSRAAKLKTIPTQVSVLRSSDLFQNSATNIIDGISKLPGISQVSSAPAISKPVIRGLGYNRVLTINDGVRQEGQQWGDEHGIEIDDNNVNKIEILKGPASLIYGSDAMAGVINIITNTPLPINTFSANIGSNYQTNSRLQNWYANAAANHNGFSWKVNGSIKNSGDYKNKYDGYVFNSKFREKNIGGAIGYNGAWGFSHLTVSNYTLLSGLTEGERNSNGNFIKMLPGGLKAEATNADFKTTKPFIPYQNINHFKIAFENSLRIRKNRLNITLGWQQNNREEHGNVDAPSEKELQFLLKTFTYTTQYNMKEVKGFSPSFGLNGMGQNNTNNGIEQLIPDYGLNDWGMFFYTQKKLGKLMLSGGARFDNRSIKAKNLMDGVDIKAPAFSKNFSNFSGSIGAAIQADSNVTIKLNIARAFRAPSLPELASNGAHEGTVRYEYGDKNLKSETSLQGDAAIELSNEHFTFNLSAFYNNINNFVFYRKLLNSTGGDSLVNVGGTDLTAFQFAQNRATLKGLECSFDLHPHPIHWFHFENTFSFVSGKFANAVGGGINIPFMPAPKLLTEIRADIMNFKKIFHNAYIKIEAENYFKQSKIFTTYNTETETTGYTLLNAGLGADVFNKKRKLFIFSFNVTNIADAAYQNHLSRLKYAGENAATGRIGIFNQGRNISFKLNIPIEGKL